MAGSGWERRASGARIGFTVAVGLRISVRCPFIGAWAAAVRALVDQHGEGIEKVIYVGMAELTEDEWWL